MKNLETRSFIYSFGLHLLIVLAIVVATLQHQTNFFYGTAVRSPQQVQIVNAMLVLPQPSLSKVITPTPPAAASVPTPPTPKTAPPSTAKPTPAPIAQSKDGTIQQKQKQAQPKQSAQQVQALQKLKSLGLSSIQQAVNSNQKEAASAAQAAERLTMQEKYMGLIQQTVKSNWINQFSPTAQLTAILKIKLDPDGNVLAVSVIQSSGNASFDRQAILAVQKSSPLPLPPDPTLVKKFMSLTLPFNNQDLQ